jgi:hypothetical protein
MQARSMSDSAATTCSTSSSPEVSASATRSSSRRRISRIIRIASPDSGWRAICERISVHSVSNGTGHRASSSPSQAVASGEFSSRSAT